MGLLGFQQVGFFEVHREVRLGKKSLVSPSRFKTSGSWRCQLTSNDEIDRSNQSWGSLSRRSELDSILGTSIVVDHCSKEGKPLKWFVRESGASDGTVVLFFHGIPSSSYSFRNVLTGLGERGGKFRCVAPDLIGFGFSEKPQPQFEFDYTTESYSSAMDRFCEKANITEAFHLVVQGWLGASWGLQYALERSDRIKSIVILNSPLPPQNNSLPFNMSRWGLPGFIGDTFCQDPMSIERALEGGGPYYLDLNDADVYRRPYMESGDSGFSLGGAVRNLRLNDAFEKIGRGFRSWKGPVLVLWGENDKYLSSQVPHKFIQDVCPDAKLEFIGNAGHFLQEDYPEPVTEALLRFYRKL